MGDADELFTDGQAYERLLDRDAAAEKCFITRSVSLKVERESTFEIASASGSHWIWQSVDQLHWILSLAISTRSKLQVLTPWA
jgi:hypothetical protein